jgi:excisionase family DNA binding protein
VSKIRKRVDPASAAFNLTVEEAATVVGIGRSSAYELIKLGQMKAVKYRRLTRVTRDEAMRVARELASGTAA